MKAPHNLPQLPVSLGQLQSLDCASLRGALPCPRLASDLQSGAPQCNSVSSLPGDSHVGGLNFYLPNLLYTGWACSLYKALISRTSLGLPVDSEPGPAAWPRGIPHSQEPVSFLGTLPAPVPGMSKAAGVQLGWAGGVSGHPLSSTRCPYPILPRVSLAPVPELSFSGSSCSKLTPVSPAISGVFGFCLLLKFGMELTCILMQ